MPVRVRSADGVAWTTLDRPPANVLDTALLGELETALSGASEDRELRLLVIAGEGKMFSAGVDVGEHLGDSIGPMLLAFERVALRLLELDVPTLAVVQGAALGGACELVTLCDLALVADDAKLGVPEITLGVVPPVAAASFPGLVGAQRAAALILTGAVISGAEAARAGLVWRSVPPTELRAETDTVVASFASKSAAALRLAKRSLRAARGLPLADGIRAADAISVRELPAMADAQEGLRAFLEKRQPIWRHR